MDYLQEIRASYNDPQRLEDLYQAACREGAADRFTADLLACYKESPDNLLYAAWYYRLQRAVHDEGIPGRSVNWKLAVPLSVVMGLIFWGLSSPQLDLSGHMPYLLLVWAPIAACFVIAFVTFASGQHRRRSLLVGIGLLGLGVYVTLFVTLSQRPHYQTLMMFHLPLLAWVGAGLSILGLRSEHRNRFAFLIKSIEVFITGGIFLIAGGVFVSITVGMFEALRVSLPKPILRLLMAGGAGAIPVLAVATVYEPYLSPLEQKFQRGLGRLIYTLMRLLLPLTLLVLMAYLLVIPFNFMEPFRNREVLIVYNAMLFAIMGLLLGATPVREDHLPERHHPLLRKGILAVAILAVLVSLYALSAIVYRTVLGGITVNRLAVIGWNGINIGILVGLIYKQFKDGPTAWIRSLQTVFSVGTNGYLVWTVFLVLAIPWLF